jgi:maleylacetoacetate isomerase/maleylpyruvate isomerase
MQLYGYWRSTAAYRVRIALALKGLAFDAIPVHLVRGGGEQHADQYRALNPLELVPTLVVDGRALTQSLAIVEWLDETYPSPPLLPASAWDRARAREMALLIACDIRPVNNLRVLNYLAGPLGADEARKLAGYRHWVEVGLRALETMLARDGRSGPYCIGDAPTLADICLVPQLYNARRFGLELSPFPALLAVDAACAALDAFRQAAPAAQPDAE